MPNLYERLQSQPNREEDGGEKPPRTRPAPAEPYTFEGAFDMYGEDGKTVIGSETWKLHATAHGLTGVSLVKVEQPQPQVRHIRLSLTHDWRWQNISVRVENGPQIMLGLENGKLVGHFRGATGLRPIAEEWRSWYEIDFHSSLFKSIIVARLALVKGESEQIRVYQLDREALLPTWGSQIYTRAEHVPSPAFPRQNLTHYTLDVDGTNERIHHLWFDTQPVLWHYRSHFKLRV